MSTCRRPGCFHAVFSWLDPHYCSSDCREKRHPPTTPIVVADIDVLKQQQGFDAATAFVVDTGELVEHRDGEWAIGQHRRLPLYGQCGCGRARRWDGQRLYCPTCDAPPPPAEPPPTRPLFHWPWRRP